MTRAPSSLRALVSVTVAVCLVWAHPVFAAGLLEKNHPLVEAGMDAYKEERYADALAAFEAAKKENPDSAVVDFNLGNTFYKLGRHAEAKEAWLRASTANEKDLKQKDYFNLGNGFVATGQEKEAMGAYRKALTLDPNDLQARHNLEVLLRKIPPKTETPDAGVPDAGSDGGPGPDAGKPDAGAVKGDGGSDGGQDGGAPDGGTPNDGGSDAGADGGSGDGGADDGGSGDAGSGDGGSDGGSDGGGGAQQGDGGSDGGAQDGGGGDGEAGADGGSDGGTGDAGEMTSENPSSQDAGTPPDLSQQDANKVLDSMERNEKNLQLWRFQQRKKPRNADEKDW